MSRLFRCGAVCCLFLACAILAAALPGRAAVIEKAPEFGGLFLDVPPPNAPVKTGPTVSRRRVATIDLWTLRSRKVAGARLAFNFFANANFEGVVENVIERGDDDFTLMGRLNGEEFSTFAVAVKDGIAIINVRLQGGGTYQLRHLGNSFYDVREIDASRYAPCGTSAEHHVNFPNPIIQPGAVEKAVASKEAKDAAGVIDVMIVYTPASRDAAGGTAAMQALINLTVDESNFTYQESQITPRLRLVHQRQVNYAETGNINVELDRLTGKTDGYVDEIHALRDTYGADVVSMFVENDDVCGVAWLMTALSPGFEDRGFSVVTWDCATGNYSFAHEIGHNMGCAHDRANAVTGLYPYSYGWRFVTAGDVTNRTIMAYAPGERIPRFSNPDVLYNGVATGVRTDLPNAAHNALTINNSASTVANWRQSTAPCIFSITPAVTNIQRDPFAGSFTLNASSNNCLWTATSLSPFITLTDATNGTGTGSILFSVTTNSGLNARTGVVEVAGWLFSVVQAGSAPFISLGEAVEQTNRTWVTGGSFGWFGQSNTTSNNADAAQSGPITHRQQSFMESVFYGPGKLSFWWKVGSEPGYDFLRVSVNGSTIYSASGVVPWQYRIIYLTNGAHVVRWTYSKDVSLDRNGDTAWLDLVQFSGPPYFTNWMTAIDPVSFELRGSPSSTVVLESSSNLATWSPLATGVLSPSGVWTYSNSIPGPPRRFYRALVP
jgi:hypothetical protein